MPSTDLSVPLYPNKQNCQKNWASVICNEFNPCGISNLSPKQFEDRLHKQAQAKVKDPFNWIFCHALCGIFLTLHSVNVEVAIKVFRCVSQNKNLRKFMLVKDKDGDVPIMSAINSKVTSGKKFKSTFQFLSKEKRRKIFSSRNKKGISPLEAAFENQLWGPVRAMFTDFFNLYDSVDRDHPLFTQAISLLHEAAKRGYSAYFEIFLSVCKSKNVPEEFILNILQETVQQKTMWRHLLKRNKLNEIRVVLKQIKLYGGIDIDSLHTDKDAKTTMLHSACRSNQKELAMLLRECGAKDDVEDAKGLKPEQRKRAIDSKVKPIPAEFPGNQEEEDSESDVSSCGSVTSSLLTVPPCPVAEVDDTNLSDPEELEPPKGFACSPNEACKYMTQGTQPKVFSESKSFTIPSEDLMVGQSIEESASTEDDSDINFITFPSESITESAPVIISCNMQLQASI